MFSHRIQVKQNRYEMMKSTKVREFGQFCENWHICIASIPPNWRDIRNSCGYKQVIRNSAPSLQKKEESE